MSVENFFFSYFNSLKRAAEKRNFFALFRKAINFFYKFGINFFKKIFLKKFKNLDKNKNVLLYNFSLDNLFKKFNCDKGSCILECEVPNGKYKFYTLTSKKTFEDTSIEEGTWMGDLILFKK